jgi:tripartite-type tricarboxylate transporter receptor subunit TctC
MFEQIGAAESRKHVFRPKRVPMFSNRNEAWRLLVLLIGLALCPATNAVAEDWPNRPIRIVAPVAPGGYSDLMARLTADRLSKAFGVAFFVENKGGGGGAVGTDYVIHAQPDGYTLWFGGGAQFTSAPLIKKLEYDPLRGLTPISMVSINGLGLVVSAALPVNTLADFFAYVRERPGKVNYGISGVGQSSHLAAALLASRETLEMTMVPYQSVPNAILGLISNDVQMYFGNMIDIIEPIRTGKVKLLGVSSSERSPLFPDVPTISEVAPRFVFTSWVGYFAPAGTPTQIIAKLSAMISEVCQEKDVADSIAKMGMTAVGSTPDYVATTIQSDLPIAKSAVQAAGLSQ